MLAQLLIHTVTVNPWTTCTAVLCLRFVLVGAAWVWILPLPQGSADLFWVRSFVRSAQAYLIGLVSSLLVSLTLCEAGICTLGTEIAISLILVALGVLTGLARERKLLRDGITLTLPGVVVFALAMTSVMWLPKSSEWIVGGWDPGVYLNQGVWVAQTGTFYPEPENAYKDLTEEGFLAFTRRGGKGAGDYRECFPGIPLDRNTRAVRNYFYRLSPTAISIVARCGGLRAATRINFIFGFFACAILAAFLLGQIPHPFCAVAATICMVAHPLWLYHLHIPVSEMLQLLLVCCIGLLLSIRTTGYAAPLLLGATVLAAVLNRISFMPFGAMLLPCIAWQDRARNDRWRVRFERSTLVVTLVLGGCFDIFVTSVTTEQLQRVVPTLIKAGVGFAAAAVIIDEIAWRPRVRRIIERTPSWLSPAACCLAIIALIGTWFLTGVDFAAGTAMSLRRILPFLGWGYVISAALGSVALYSDQGKEAHLLKIFICWLAAVSAVVLVQSFMAIIYPWATRRYLPFTVPCLSVLLAYLCHRLWARTSWQIAWGKGLALLVLLAVLLSSAKSSWHAWNRTEYDGLSAALTEIAEQVGPEEIVVVDHPWWGTPLRFLHGVRILNARPFYARDEGPTMSAGLAALEHLRNEGANIRFLTSTERGLDVYPLDPGKVELDWTSETVNIDEIIHHKRMSDFKIKHKTRVFRLYTWSGR